MTFPPGLLGSAARRFLHQLPPGEGREELSQEVLGNRIVAHPDLPCSVPVRIAEGAEDNVTLAKLSWMKRLSGRFRPTRAFYRSFASSSAAGKKRSLS